MRKGSTPSLGDFSRARSFLLLHPKNLRKLGKNDVKQVIKLIDPKFTYPLFGKVDIDRMIALSYLTVGIEDENGKIAAAMILHTHPDIPVLPPWEWDHFMYNFYDISDANSYNTLWIHFIGWDAKYELLFMQPMIHSVFKEYPALKYMFLIAPPYCSAINKDFLGDLASKHLPKGCHNQWSSQVLFSLERDTFRINYKIRRAVEEDNDDLVPLIHQHCKRLEELYGKYYIAEILTCHKDTGRHIIVAEYEGNAVAVVILNPTVNYRVLNEQFELTTFNGLRKTHEKDQVHWKFTKRQSVFNDTDYSSELDAINEIVASFEDDEKRSARSAGTCDAKVTCNKSDHSSHEERVVHISDSSSAYSLILTTSSLILYQDDDDGEDVQQVDEAVLSTHSQLQSSMAGSSTFEVLRELEETEPNTDPRITFLEMMEKLDIESIDNKSMAIPTFYGEDNAFCLEVAAADPDHEYCLSLILECVYECFPDRDYCIMHLPSDMLTEDWVAPFVRVISRPTGTFPNELYVLHKNALLGKMGVEVTTREHMRQIKELISTIPMHTIILTQCEIFLELENSPYTAFVLVCEDKVVGVAVLSEEFNIEQLDALYEIDPWINAFHHRSGGYGATESILVSPVFQNHAKYFLSEIHRLGDYTAIFYRHMFDKNGKDRPVVNILHWFLPVMPRQQPELNSDMLLEEGYPLSDAIIRKDGFVLYLSSVSLCAISRFSLNTRIVVVGCSNTSLSFMISLACTQFNPNFLVNFNNITMVCQYGIEPKLPKKISELFLTEKYFFGGKYMDMQSLKTHINIVQGTMTKIDRKDKYIVVNEQCTLNYDLLFLMSGEKFQKPLKNHRMPFAENPENMFLIHCGGDAHNAVIKLKEMRNKNQFTTETIVVYGHYLHAYTCVAGLLSFGVPGSDIILVEPFPYVMNIDRKQRQSISMFNDPEIYHAIKDEILKLGITMYSSFYFIDWQYDAETNLILSAKFESKHRMIELECFAIFFYYDKNISPRMYQVINNAGLVFDGRLVIDNTCQTNDPCIYGAGTLTKYSRKYYASHMIHKFFNRNEIGFKLGQQIRNKLIPYSIRRFETKKHGWNFQLEMRDRLVPIYHQPVMRYCRLPGDIYYLCIDKPGKSMPWETAANRESSSQVFITGNCHNLNHQGFFKLQLNEFQRVENITCLTKFPIDVKNLYCIWGKHESLLNSLQTRFELLMITDFFQFFQQPWAYAIYHDRFEDLIGELNYHITSSTGNNEEESLINGVIRRYEEKKWKKLSPEEEKEIENAFSALQYPKTIEEKVLDFIKENLNYLPMYAHPIVIRKILEGFDRSLLFRKS